jgi:hypothetical protein
MMIWIIFIANIHLPIRKRWMQKILHAIVGMPHVMLAMGKVRTIMNTNEREGRKTLIYSKSVTSIRSLLEPCCLFTTNNPP